jgi:hypothetical protein
LKSKLPELAINRKAHGITPISGVSTAASRNLLHESRTRLWPRLAAPAGGPAQPKIDFAAKMLREGLPQWPVNDGDQCERRAASANAAKCHENSRNSAPVGGQDEISVQL